MTANLSAKPIASPELNSTSVQDFFLWEFYSFVPVRGFMDDLILTDLTIQETQV